MQGQVNICFSGPDPVGLIFGLVLILLAVIWYTKRKSLKEHSRVDSIFPETDVLGMDKPGSIAQDEEMRPRKSPFNWAFMLLVILIAVAFWLLLFNQPTRVIPGSYPSDTELNETKE
ncbi:hypothetical protein KFE98_03090 [bacterium SCSIO 12741]|nr:hypothetical protein KFE98_03090 [bacterium SCSIO 12741]